MIMGRWRSGSHWERPTILSAASRNAIAPMQTGPERCVTLPGSERRALADRRRQRALVEIVELAADRHTVRQPGDLELGPVQQIGDVVRRGLTVDGGVE